jgi:hypothetical protein
MITDSFIIWWFLFFQVYDVHRPFAIFWIVYKTGSLATWVTNDPLYQFQMTDFVEWELVVKTDVFSKTQPVPLGLAWMPPELNPGCCDEKPATNRLSYGMAIFTDSLSLYFLLQKHNHENKNKVVTRD